MESVLVGAFKVKDGLFLGDEFAAQDLEFVVANKVTRIINCAFRQVPNHWEPIGVHYLSFAWFDTENQVILDSSDKNLSSVFNFIEQGLESGESVLVHSVRGVSRCVCIITAYLMKKYMWSLYKSLDFIAFRRPDLDLNPGFVTQLGSFEARMIRNSRIPRTDQWDQVLENGEELILRNTFLNARMGGQTDYHLQNNEVDGPCKIKWENADPDTINVRSKNRTDCGFVTIRSCLKGYEKKELKVPMFNLEIMKEKSAYSKFNFAKGIRPEPEDKTKIRSNSLNRNDNRLVKEAINAARGLIENDQPKERNALKVQGISSRTIKKKPKEDIILKVSRPTTAPQKRAPSPKTSEKRATTFNPSKPSSFGSIKKRSKHNL